MSLLRDKCVLISYNNLLSVTSLSAALFHYQGLRWILGNSHTFKLEDSRHLSGSGGLRLNGLFCNGPCIFHSARKITLLNKDIKNTFYKYINCPNIDHSFLEMSWLDSLCSEGCRHGFLHPVSDPLTVTGALMVTLVYQEVIY